MNNEMAAEARNYIINGVLAYVEALGLIDEDFDAEDWANEINDGLLVVEAMVPMFKQVYEIEKRRGATEDSFFEWVVEQLGKRGSSFGGI